MTLQSWIRVAEDKIAVLRVELNDWIPAKCLIDERMAVLREEIKSWEAFLRIVKEEAEK